MTAPDPAFNDWRALNPQSLANCWPGPLQELEGLGLLHDCQDNTPAVPCVHAATFCVTGDNCLPYKALAIGGPDGGRSGLEHFGADLGDGSNGQELKEERGHDPIALQFQAVHCVLPGVDASFVFLD